MGKLTIKNEQRIFNDNILSRQERIVIDYAIFFEEKPSFVTYYQQNMIRSSRESTLEDTTALLGADSPIVFDKIDDLPIYKLSGIESISIDDSEFGQQTNIAGEGIIVPNLIEPREDDFFVLTYDTRRYIFVIVDVNIDSIAGMNYYKINFKLDYRNEQEILNQLSGEEYVTDYDNIGTSHKAIIYKPDKLVVGFLEETQKRIIEFINESFYYEHLDYIKFEDEEDNLLYDPMVVKFLTRNELLQLFNMKQQYSSIFMSDIDFNDTYEKEIRKSYKQTIYAALETKDKSNITKLNFSRWPISGPDSYLVNELTFEGRKFTSTIYDSITMPSDYNIFDSLFLTNLQTNTLYGDAGHIVEDIIIRYINDGITKDNIVLLLSDVELDDDDFRSMFFAIMLLYIIKVFYNKILEFTKII